MNMPVQIPLMTAEEFLQLPDEPGVERWLIDGRVREKRYKDKTMTYRNRWHGKSESRIAQLVGDWLDLQPNIFGEVYSGEAGCLLQRNPDLIVGIDVAYFAVEPEIEETETSTLLIGVPTLAIEILSPFDTVQDINEKLDKYLKAGVPLVWIVDPYRQTILAYRPGEPPVLFTVGQDLTAEPHLPGFRVPVLKIFQRKAKKTP